MTLGGTPASGAGTPVSGVWLADVPLDTLGLRAAELAASGAAGVVCAPRRAERDAVREDAVRALADALKGRPVSACGSQGFAARVRRANLVARIAVRGDAPAEARRLAAAGVACHFAWLGAPSRLDAVLEGWLSGLEARAAEAKDLPAAWFGVDAGRLEGVWDSIANARIAGAPTDSVRSAYRLLVGRVGWAVAAVCRRRLSAALNGARFKALSNKGAPRPRLLVRVPPGRLAEFSAPETDLAVPFAAAVALPAVPGGRVLEEGYDEAKRLLDKLANYQLDLDVVSGELEVQP